MKPQGLAAGLAGTQAAVPNPALGQVGQVLYDHYVDPVVKAAQAPHDAMYGGLPLGSPDLADRGLGLAGLVMGGGMPMAEEGALGMAGGKLPRASPNGPERIAGASFTVAGKTYLGANHYEAMEQAAHDLGMTNGDMLFDHLDYGNGSGKRDAADGFVTTTGRIVSREEAARIADSAAQGTASRPGSLKMEDVTPSYSDPDVYARGGRVGYADGGASDDSGPWSDFTPVAIAPAQPAAALTPAQQADLQANTIPPALAGQPITQVGGAPPPTPSPPDPPGTPPTVSAAPAAPQPAASGSADGPWSDFAATAAAPLLDGFASRADREPDYTPDQQRDAQKEIYLGEAQQTRATMNPVAAGADTLVRGLARAFPLMDDLSAGVNTVLGQGTGDSFSQRYQDNLDRERAVDAADDTDRPIASYTGQIAGSLALPAGVLGRVAGFVPRIAAGAALGTGYGAAYGFGQGDSLSDRLAKARTGAVYGAVGGAAAPVAVEAAGLATAPVSKLASTLRGSTTAGSQNLAAQRVVGTLVRDWRSGSPGLSTTDWAAAHAAGQPVVVGDVGGEATRELARSAGNTSSEAHSALLEATGDRYAGQSTRMQDFTRGLFGGSDLDNTATTQALQARADGLNRANYNAAYADPAAQSMWSPEFQRLAAAPDVQDAIKTAIRKAQNKSVAAGATPIKIPFDVDATGNLVPRTNPDGSTITPSLPFWDQVQRALRDTSDSAFRAGKSEMGSDASQLRRQLLSAMEDPATGVPAFGAARTGAYKAFAAEDALEAGQNFAGLNKAGKITDQVAAIGKMSPPEKELFARGFASQLIQRGKNPGTSRNIPAMFDSDAFREKAAAALGPTRADQLEAFLRTERMMTRLRTAVSGNSSTVRQLMNSAVAGGIAGGAEGLREGFDVKTAGAVVMGALLHHGYARINENVARHVGEMLASSDPEIVKRAIVMFHKRPGWMAGLRNADAYLAQVLSERTAPKAD